MNRSRRVLFIAGPSGVGKTTLVCGFQGEAAVYRETPDDNPYLKRHLEGDPLEAAKSQGWFLDKMERFLEREQSSSSSLIVVDQHPFGVGLTYTTLFRQEGLIAGADAMQLERRARAICDKVRAAARSQLTVLLSAGTDTLLDRISKRAAGPGLSLGRIERVNKLFQTSIFPGPHIVLNTEVLTPEEEGRAIRTWIKSK